MYSWGNCWSTLPSRKVTSAVRSGSSSPGCGILSCAVSRPLSKTLVCFSLASKKPFWSYQLQPGKLVAARAAVVLHQSAAFVLELWIVHELGRRISSVGMAKRNQIAGDVTRLFDGQPQGGHHCGQLYLEQVFAVGRAVVVQIENERLIEFAVVLGAQVNTGDGVIGPCAFTRVVHPADQIIKIVLLAHAAEVGGKSSA